MLDTGTESNLIKLSNLKSNVGINVEINLSSRFVLKSISDERIETIGSTKLTLYGKTIEFYVVKKDFLGQTQDLLGIIFLSDTINLYPKSSVQWRNVTIPFSNRTIIIHARSVMCIFFQLPGHLSHISD
ncbi:hypothetical protein WN51_10979 [Melipona quadrifasciata]|uniref:Peptidase A2 domain-containing protein n=1 Tax=Melipona quadrifasciata TaxID=166423 RepID=A0A0M8ZN16_9HYME|nr:hypothetical protein WN51_10979 [Melipona quadrifasciata]